MRVWAWEIRSGKYEAIKSVIVLSNEIDILLNLFLRDVVLVGEKRALRLLE